MTREQLETYRSKKAEIKELQDKLSHLNDDDNMVGNSVIMDYRTGYPMPQTVVGVDWDKVYRMESRYKNRIQNLQKECDEIEQFVEDIEDSLTRRIFRRYYLDGLTQEKVGREVYLNKSNISRKIDIFFKSQQMQQMQQYNEE